MFAAFGAVGMLFTVWMAVEAVRRGQTQSWLWIILFFGPIAVYFFIDEAEYVPDYLQKDVKPWVKKAKKAMAQLGAEGA